MASALYIDIKWKLHLSVFARPTGNMQVQVMWLNVHWHCVCTVCLVVLLPAVTYNDKQNRAAHHMRQKRQQQSKRIMAVTIPFLLMVRQCKSCLLPRFNTLGSLQLVIIHATAQVFDTILNGIQIVQCCRQVVDGWPR